MRPLRRWLSELPARASGLLVLVLFDVLIIAGTACTATSCQALKDYGEAMEDAAPPVAGGGIGAAVGGPFGAAVGAGIGYVVSFFRRMVQALRKENVELRSGKLFGAETAHNLPAGPWQGPGFPKDLLPWYLDPWTDAKIAGGWALLLLVVLLLARRFGHPAFGWLKGLLSLGVIPAVKMIRGRGKADGGG